MPLPDHIQRLITDGLSEMHGHPSHHFDWRTRRTLYHLLRAEEPTIGYGAHGWLAVITAEHVLPLFTSTFPQDRLPYRLLWYARRILTGSLLSASRRLDLIEDQGYMRTGIDMIFYDLRDGVIAYNAEYAGAAAYKALVEARGTHDLLDRVEALYDSCEQDSTFSDPDIAHLAAFSDTASTAAIAAACNVESDHIDPARLKAFWEWWGKQRFLKPGGEPAPLRT
jgi:hypothetical protein